MFVSGQRAKIAAVKPAALCVSILIACAPISAHAQSASKVIERYIDAIGGKNAIEKIVSTEMTGTVRAADGRTGAFVHRTRRPDLFSLNWSVGDLRQRAGFNGRSAWQDDGVNGVRTLYGQAASRVRGEARHANTRLLAPEKVIRISMAVQEHLRGRPVTVIVAITPDGVSRTLFFDNASHLLVKDRQETDDGVEERFFDDYRPVDRVMEPHRIEWHRNSQVFQIAIERVTHNVPVDATAFDAPAAETRPSLDIEATLAAAGRAEQRAESVRTSYAYTQSLAIRVIDAKGVVTERKGSAFEMFHLGGQAVGRQIRKMDGQPLSEAERRREDKRVTDLVEAYQRQGTSAVAARRGREDADTSGFSLRGLGGSLVLSVPVMTRGWFPAYRRVSDFNNIRRERNGPRAALVMDFRPRPGVTPVGNVERQVSKLAGTLWIDEASQEVIRIESHFIDDYDSIVQGSAVWMEQTLVNDEVWLPSHLETNVRRSLGFGALAQTLVTMTLTAHKKFGVETDSAVTLPDAVR
jgi:hypothetical protein